MGDGDWVVVRPDGEIIDIEIPKDIGPATLMVGPVTDALKSHDGRLLTGAIDRDRVWGVEAFALNRVVVRRLDVEELTPLELCETVTSWRLAWQKSEMGSD